MFAEILDLAVQAAENSFVQVTAFVGAVLLLFGYLDYVLAGRLVKMIENSKRFQPIIGAILGLTPGCGGAIFLMPLFPRRIVSFGTITAALIATMGDSAFVFMTVMPKQFLMVSAISFVVAIITGYLVDLLPLGERLVQKFEEDQERRRLEHAAHEALDHSIFEEETGITHEEWAHIGHAEGDDIDLILHHSVKGHQPTHSLGYKLTHSAYAVYWVFISIGLVLGILDILQVDINALAVPHLGLVFGLVGTALSVIMMVLSKKFLVADTHEESEMKLASIKETLIHNAQETAFVGTWVFAAYLAYELLVLFLGSGSHAAGEALITGFLSQTGLVAVLIGVLIGVIPGCGPQIIFVTLFTRGLVPFSAVLANAISQDGDALFPLIAIDRRSAFWVTVVNTIPALIVGFLAYLIEFRLL
ncbi:MAG TPA: arsenic efflux protein [Firmicutes bacterium]|jgi:hypothetical protein|nr:putative manganese transporter [Bacillota bacterium]HHT42303.1 arsenic efflux protein [Bacillota bacterium]